MTLPAVLALHGAAGMLPEWTNLPRSSPTQGFAVYVLHYFDRTDTQYADKPTILRNFPIWMKTLWDAISFVETSPTSIASESPCSDFHSAHISRSPIPPSMAAFERSSTSSEACREK